MYAIKVSLTSATHEGTVGRWLKKEGDKIDKGQVLLEVETSDSIIELEAASSGTLLKILLKEGTVITNGELIGLIGKKGEDVSAFLKELENETLEIPLPQIQNTKMVKKKESSTDKSEPKQEKPKPSGKVTPILMPQPGQSMEEGTIVKWHVKAGDKIKAGDVIFDVETDKATVEIEAIDSGRVAKIVIGADETAQVKQTVAYLADNDADVEAYLQEQPSAQPDTKQPKPPTPQSEEVSVPENVIPILMPQPGQSMEEGTIVKWHVKVGDQIKAGDVIFDVETDKATVEIEAIDSGRVAKILIGEDETAQVKQTVGIIADNDADADAYIAAQGSLAKSQAQPAPKAAEQKPTIGAPKSKLAVSDSGRIKASPAARKIAAELGIDLTAVGTGSGPGGRIISKDVETATVTGTEPVRKKMSNMRKAIARNLLYSKQNIPHFYIKQDIEADELFGVYKQTKEKFKCTINDFVVLACARVMREFPAFRSKFDNEEIVEFPTANVGIAVGTEKGLVVPVLVGADRMNLENISVQARKIVENARNGKLEGLGQGNFTITNLGMFGIKEFQAIINPPEAAIIAVGAINESIKVSEGAIKPVKVMTVTLSVDHRVIDGLVAAQFLIRLKELLEEPQQLL